MIVSQKTLHVYGHVIASNPLGGGYVVPFRETLRQIRDALGAIDVSLPNPGLMLANFVNHYSKAGDAGFVEKAKEILASMIVGNQFDTGNDKNGNLATIEALLTVHANVENRADRQIPSFQALRSGQEVASKELIDKGPGKGLDGSSDWTALSLAASRGYLEVVRLLLEKGTDAEVEDHMKTTALHLAAKNGHKTVIQLLLEKGVISGTSERENSGGIAGQNSSPSKKEVNNESSVNASSSFIGSLAKPLATSSQQQDREAAYRSSLFIGGDSADGGGLAVFFSPQLQKAIPARQSQFFINGAGIDREVITTDICRYLGNDALVRPGTHKVCRLVISIPTGPFIVAE